MELELGSVKAMELGSVKAMELGSELVQLKVLE